MSTVKECKGLASLRAAILKDISAAYQGRRFSGEVAHEELCSNRKCRYCPKFQWVIDRAQHYSDVLGIARDEIINAWEESRNYWYMNFYQDAQQPLLVKDDHRGIPVKIFETPDDIKPTIKTQLFRCPACGGESTDAYRCSVEQCDWASFGLFRTMGKGVLVVTRKPFRTGESFMPIDWEVEFAAASVATA